MHIEIISPDKVVFTGEVNSVRLPGQEGYFEVLKDHASIISLLQKGQIRIIKSDQTTEYFDVEFGFVEVINNKITVLV
jgi:F-type H+-transporting ATPase subunit epsilon